SNYDKLYFGSGTKLIVKP
ncbi:rCG64457, partial [Rattus norvegicus]